ncbi:hypothetical protein SUGI_0949020 [Cryptomeria japonica]|nr:hypothetical protein SUGI_0949020 [Cryptomeria japonica]
MGTNIADPQLVQEILSVRSDDYEKIEANNALKKLEGEELLDLKGEKWAQHKRIINPAIDVLVSTHIYELYMVYFFYYGLEELCFSTMSYKFDCQAFFWIGRNNTKKKSKNAIILKMSIACLIGNGCVVMKIRRTCGGVEWVLFEGYMKLLQYA